MIRDRLCCCCCELKQQIAAIWTRLANVVSKVSINGQTLYPDGEGRIDLGNKDHVTWDQLVTTGTKIAEISINEHVTEVYSTGGGGGEAEKIDLAYDERHAEWTSIQLPEELIEAMADHQVTIELTYQTPNGTWVTAWVTQSAVTPTHITIRFSQTTYAADIADNNLYVANIDRDTRIMTMRLSSDTRPYAIGSLEYTLDAENNPVLNGTAFIENEMIERFDNGQCDLYLNITNDGTGESQYVKVHDIAHLNDKHAFGLTLVRMNGHEDSSVSFKCFMHPDSGSSHLIVGEMVATGGAESPWLKMATGYLNELTGVADTYKGEIYDDAGVMDASAIYSAILEGRCVVHANMRPTTSSDKYSLNFYPFSSDDTGPLTYVYGETDTVYPGTTGMSKAYANITLEEDSESVFHCYITVLLSNTGNLTLQDSIESLEDEIGDDSTAGTIQYKIANKVIPSSSAATGASTAKSLKIDGTDWNLDSAGGSTVIPSATEVSGATVAKSMEIDGTNWNMPSGGGWTRYDNEPDFIAAVVALPENEKHPAIIFGSITSASRSNAPCFGVTEVWRTSNFINAKSIEQIQTSITSNHPQFIKAQITGGSTASTLNYRNIVDTTTDGTSYTRTTETGTVGNIFVAYLGP